MKYIAYFTQNAKEFEYELNVNDDVKEPLFEADERAQKLAETYGWGYLGVGPQLTDDELSNLESQSQSL